MSTLWACTDGAPEPGTHKPQKGAYIRRSPALHWRIARRRTAPCFRIESTMEFIRQSLAPAPTGGLSTFLSSSTHQAEPKLELTMRLFPAVDHSGTGRLAFNGPASSRPSRPQARIHPHATAGRSQTRAGSSGSGSSSSSSSRWKEERQRPFPAMQSAR